MAIVSDNLIHFLGRKHKDAPDEQFEVFKKIIIDGLRFGANDVSFGRNGIITNYIACFTDIPLSLCNEHIAQYGKFGIGFKKESLKKVGAHSARYFIDSDHLVADGAELDLRGAMQNNLQSQMDMVLRIGEAADRVDSLALFDQTGQKVVDHAFLVEWLGLQRTVLSFDQKTGEQGAPDSSPDLYYREREWRLVPLRGNRGLEQESLEKVRKDENGQFFYMFLHDDVNMILAPNAEMRVRVIEFLNELDGKEDRLKEFAEKLPPIIAYDDLRKW